MTTETFDNRIHNALFFEGNSVINGQNYSEKWSDLILSALKDVGVFDNIDIQDTPPTDTTRLWLDTRPHPTLPSVLRIYNAPTLEWRQVTFNDLFSGGGGGGGGTSLARYESTAALRTAIQNGDLVDGERFFLYDDPMIVDRSLDDDPASWLFNPNGDANLGVRSMAQLPGNYYAFMGFKTQGNNRLYINTSPDGRRFFRVNKYPIQRGGGDSLIGGRDSQLYWNENTGEWWAPVTSGSEVTDWDFSVFRSKDLVTWGLSRGFLDADSPAGLVRGQSVPGGTIPVERQWSNKFARFDGRLYIITSLQVLPSGTNPFGNSGPRLRPYFAEVIDEVNMRFGPVTPMQIGNNDEAKLNPDVILVDGTYWCCIKDSPTRTVEVWSSSSLAGPWTLRQTIDIDPNDLDSLEGNTWGVHRYTDPNDDQNTLVKYRIMLSNNRDADDNLVGRQLFVESLTGPGGPYGDIQDLEFSQATRNGVVTNVAMVDDPRAIRTLLAAESVYGGEVRVDIDEAADLRNPTHNLWPQERFEYEIGGASGSTTVTIQGKLADTFYLAVHNTNPQARITVVGNEFSRPFTVGGGYQELVEVRWSREIERYIPVGRYAVPGVSGSARLDAGTTTIIPTLDTEYYILGETGSTTVTINERGADSFFVAVHNTAPGATVTFANTSVCRPFTVGGGNQEIIRVIWSEQLGQYMPVGRLASGSGTGGVTVQDEGTALSTAATTLNFTGAGVTATGTGATKTINIPGGSAGAANDFRTRAAANAALASASDGTMFTVNGIEAVVDSTATGNESVFHDISGGIGARLIGDVIDTRFFEVGTEQNSDDTANLIAANTYALAAHTAANGGIKFIVSGYVPVTSPLVIGQTLEGFEIDMGGARFEVLAGWTGGTSGYVLDLRGRTATKKLPFVNCNKRCNGIRFGNNAGSTIIGGAVYRMTEIGFRVSGSNCTFINQFGYEYDNGDPEFNTDANFVADVIRIVGNDLKMISPNVGWAARPIYLAAGAAEVELIAPHPFNGNPNADGSTILQRAHPRCIVSDAGGRVYISDLYLDNGYIEDRTANLRVLSGRALLLTNRVTITEPMFRVNADNDVNTVVDNYQGQFGFYTGAWQNDASNLVTDIHESAFSGPSVGLQRVTKVRGRDTTILREAGVDFNYAKRGDGTATITQRYRPGTGGSVDLQYSNGVLKVSSGLDGDAAVNPGSIQLYEDNPTGTTGSSILMKNTGDTGTTTITTSASGLLVDGSPISGGGGGVTVQDEGSALTTTATTLNFTGSGVTASGTGATKEINIPGDPGFITEDATTGTKFIVSGSADNEAGVLNLYPEGTDGVGIGVSSIGWAAAGGSELVRTNMRTNGVLVTTLNDGTTQREQSSVSEGHNISAGTTIDPTNGYFQYVVLSAARTLDVANFNNYDRVLLDVRNADTNTLTITSSSGTIRWVGGSAPSSFDVRTLLGIARRGSDIFIGAVGF